MREQILEEAEKLFGIDERTGRPLRLTEEQQIKYDATLRIKPQRNKCLKYLAGKVVEERTALQQAPKTLLKIRRAADWFLEHRFENDIDITIIEFDQVHAFVVQDLKNGAASSTINGHLYGLTQIWKRAKLSKLVTGENPFGGHGVRKHQTSYDPFTLAEIYQLHRAANGSLKTLIHAAATTGARLNELLTAEVKTPSTFDKPCWLFKFRDRGKTEQSTRVVPMHPSLALPKGFTFKELSDRTVTRQFKELRESRIKETVHELTGKPRKLSFHSFRTTVVTELTVTHRINEKVVGKITGHLAGSSKVGSIMCYINPNDLQILFDIVRLLPWNPESLTDPVKGEA